MGGGGVPITAGEILILVYMKNTMINYPELPLLLTAAKRTQGHLKWLPHRVQVIFNNLNKNENLHKEQKLAHCHCKT